MEQPDRSTRRRVILAVRRGEALTDPTEARMAVERVAVERRDLRRVRRVIIGLCALLAVGVVVGLSAGPFLLWYLSAGLLLALLPMLFVYFPRMERNVSRAEELNRAVVDDR